MAKPMNSTIGLSNDHGQRFKSLPNLAHQQAIGVLEILVHVNNIVAVKACSFELRGGICIACLHGD